MTDIFTEDQVVATITRLTRHQLVAFIAAEFVKPDRCDGRYQFRRIDIARLELLCDLFHDLDLDETAVAIVISLIDQLNAARQERTALVRALDSLPDDLRAQIIAALPPTK